MKTVILILSEPHKQLFLFRINRILLTSLWKINLFLKLNSSADIILRRGGISNLAQTPPKKLNTQSAFSNFFPGLLAKFQISPLCRRTFVMNTTTWVVFEWCLCKRISNCVKFSWKQRISLQNLRSNMKFVYTPFSLKLLKFYIFISINHLYWNLRCFIVGKISPGLRIFSV